MQIAFLWRPLPGRVEVVNPFADRQPRNGLMMTRWSLSRKSVRTPWHHSAKQCTKNPSKILSTSSENRPKGTKKSPPNRPKITKNQGSEGSRGPLGEVWEPWGPPGEPRSPKMCENHVRGPPWAFPLGGHFRYFSDFSVFLWHAFSEGGFGGLPGTISSGFWDDFGREFRRFLYNFRCTLHIANHHFHMVFTRV